MSLIKDLRKKLLLREKPTTRRGSPTRRSNQKASMINPKTRRTRRRRKGLIMPLLMRRVSTMNLRRLTLLKSSSKEALALTLPSTQSSNED